MADNPPALLDPVAAICRSLPEVVQEPAWIGDRWRVRGRTFAHLYTLDPGDRTELRPEGVADERLSAITFRVPDDELEALRSAGHPFYVAGWGRDVMRLVVDDSTDWDEVRELLTDSYLLLAPQRLQRLVVAPD